MREPSEIQRIVISKYLDFVEAVRFCPVGSCTAYL